MAHHEDHMRHVVQGHEEQADMGVEHTHPGPGLYIKIGLILTIITAIEVSAFYIPAWEQSAIYAPSMLFMSGIKFALVVMFYMHLKFDHRLFRFIFTGPFIIAIITIIALLFLFGKIAIRTGLVA